MTLTNHWEQRKIRTNQVSFFRKAGLRFPSVKGSTKKTQNDFYTMTAPNYNQLLGFYS